MTAKIQWRLRTVAAERGIKTGPELARRLRSTSGKHMSGSSIHALMTTTPQIVKLETLSALCLALDCTPNDLLDLNQPESQV